jgi:hypothetical protein
MTPFGLVYQALWSMLLTRPAFQAVKEGNRIAFVGITGNPEKASIMPADRPEVAIFSTNVTFRPRVTSDSTQITRLYNVVFKASDLDLEVAGGLQTLEWELVRAVMGYEQTLKALQWKGKPFVKDLSPGTSVVGQGKYVDDVAGWQSLWPLTVNMYFTTTDLLPESP